MRVKWHRLRDDVTQDGVTHDDVTGRLGRRTRRPVPPLRTMSGFSPADGFPTELVVCNEDGTWKSVIVAEGLRTCDLCELLAHKNNVTNDVNWSLVERWQDPAIERTVEDHEDVLNTYRIMKTAHSNSSFYFKKDFGKYEFFHNPQQFFPDSMIELPNGKSSANTTSLARIIALQSLLTTSAPTPQVFGWLWLAGPESRVWRRAYFWLRNDVLYYTMEATDDPPPRERDKFAVFAQLEHYSVYGCSDARRDFKAPCDEAVILRTGHQLRCLACDDSATRRCWQTALRVAKYGKQLHENYNFQRIQHENEQSSSPRERYCYSASPKMPIPRSRTLSNGGLSGSGSGGGSLPRAAPVSRTSCSDYETTRVRPSDYDSVRVPNQSMRSLVAMDYTGSCGRVVSDPVEARAIELAEGHHLRRTHALKRLSELAAGASARDIEGAIHNTQPWYHGNLTRDEASQLLHKHNGRDGLPAVVELTRKAIGTTWQLQTVLSALPASSSACSSAIAARAVEVCTGRLQPRLAAAPRLWAGAAANISKNTATAVATAVRFQAQS